MDINKNRLIEILNSNNFQLCTDDKNSHYVKMVNGRKIEVSFYPPEASDSPHAIVLSLEFDEVSIYDCNEDAIRVILGTLFLSGALNTENTP